MQTTFLKTFGFLLFCLALAACGNDGSSRITASDGTGAITFRAVWPNQTSPAGASSKVFFAPPAGVATVRFIVSGPSMTAMYKDYVATPGVDQSGSIAAVPVGTNRALTLQAIDASGYIVYEKSAHGLTVNNNLTTDAGTLIMTVPTWTPTAVSGATPSARYAGLSLSTGRQMVIWGGTGTVAGPLAFMNTGALYDPVADAWTPITTVNAPAGRRNHRACWTGREVIVWGGQTGGSSQQYQNSGGRYDPSLDSWKPTDVINAPTGRYSGSAIWTGTEMLVWGGVLDPAFYPPFGYTNTGGRYNPVTDKWIATSTENAPNIGYQSSIVWTGKYMIVWGGYDNTTGADSNEGGIYDPSTDTWTPLPTLNTPSGRTLALGVWTGKKMVVWGGVDQGGVYHNDGAQYDPITNLWSATSGTNVPDGMQSGSGGVWTGSEMAFWGGTATGAIPSQNGGRYNPETDTWTKIISLGSQTAPGARTRHSVAWDGIRMTQWGGWNGNQAAAVFYNDGGNYLIPGNTPPHVRAVHPISGATGVNPTRLNNTLTAIFSEPLSTTSISGQSFTLTDQFNSSVTGTVGLDASGTILSFTPTAILAPDMTYTASIANTVTDLNGIPMVSNYTWQFTTSPVSGSLDTAWGGGRIISYLSTTAMNILSGLAIQGDGKVVAVGYTNYANTDFVVSRFTPTGALDPTFGANGTVITPIGTGNDQARAVAMAPGGKIVVTGNTFTGASNIGLIRYTSSGALDTTFNTTGIVTTGTSTQTSYGTAVAVQQDGKIIVAGDWYNGTNYDFVVARYNTNGTLDTTFSTDGLVTLPVGTGSDNVSAMVLQQDGKIIVTGTAAIGGVNQIAVVRLNSDGTPDSGFNANGINTVQVPGSDQSNGRSVAVQPDGKILVTGYRTISAGSINDFATVRFNANGTVDTSFGSSGYAVTTLGATKDCYGIGVAVQEDGRIVAAGYGNPGSTNDFLLARYIADGTVDTSFGPNGTGIVQVLMSPNADTATSMAVQYDGKLVVGGMAQPGFTAWGIARAWP